MRARRVGLLGGTFDPIHRGHLDAGRAAESALGLDELIVIPSRLPPHRPQPIASSYHRFAMVALAIADRPRWRASDMELLGDGPSFTSGTLRRLHEEGFAPTGLFFILGADAFAEIETWQDFPAILDLAHFAVVSRPGWPASLTVARLPALARRVAPASEAETRTTTSIFPIDAPTADVAATAMRERAGRGEPLGEAVPPVSVNTLSGTDFTRPFARERPGTPPNAPSRQAGCMAKTDKRRKAVRLPGQVAIALRAAEDKKAEDLVVLDLRKAAGFTDYFLICSGGNPRQIRAIADGVLAALAGEGVKPAHVEGYERSEWVLLDYFDFIVHIFGRDRRDFYGLERLWGSAERIEPAG